MNDGSRCRFTPVAQKVAKTTEPDNQTSYRAQGDMSPPRQRDDGDEIDLLHLFGVLWRSKLIILAFLFLSTLAGGYYAYVVAVPEYAAVARLAMQVRNQQVVDLESVISGVSTEQAAINTELEVIQSRGLIEHLVTDMNLVMDPEFNVRLRERPKFGITPVKELIKSVLLGPQPEEPTPTAEEIRIETAKLVAEKITVSSQRNTYLYDIRVVTTDRKKSAEMANRLAQIYLDDQIEIKFSATEYAVNWLSGRVTELEAELREKEDAIKELRAKTDLVSLDALEGLNLRAKDIRERLAEAHIAAMAAQMKAGETARMAAGEDFDTIADALNDPTLTRLAELIAAGDSSATQAFKQRLATLVQRDQAILEREFAQRDALQLSNDRIQEQIRAQNKDLVQINQLVRDADATRVLYETFLARLKETSVQIGLQQADSRILSEALPGNLVKPRKSMILALSFILGGMLGVAIVLARHFLHDGFRTSEDLEQMTGYTVLGQIPKMPIRRRDALLGYLRNKPTSAAAEAVRNLRTSVLLSNIDHRPKVIMSTSSIPGEGKTTQAISLAQNLSGLGKKVLLVEADIRRSTFTNYFQQASPHGLVTVISGEIPIGEAVLQDQITGVDVLMGGKTGVNAADLFSSEKFDDFCEEMRSIYDFIIIDTPPVLVVSDARLIAGHTDAIIYSVSWNRTNKSQVAEGLRQFSSVGIRVAGLVLSQIDPRGMKRYGYAGRYGAYSGYGRGYYGES